MKPPSVRLLSVPPELASLKRLVWLRFLRLVSDRWEAPDGPGGLVGVAASSTLWMALLAASGFAVFPGDGSVAETAKLLALVAASCLFLCVHLRLGVACSSSFRSGHWRVFWARAASARIPSAFGALFDASAGSAAVALSVVAGTLAAFLFGGGVQAALDALLGGSPTRALFEGFLWASGVGYPLGLILGAALGAPAFEGAAKCWAKACQIPPDELADFENSEIAKASAPPGAPPRDGSGRL